jgi:ABC-type phosphate/phosphonate transport system ATPase subunit
MDRATEMDITMIGLQNAGKTSLLRVLAVRILTSPPNIVLGRALTSELNRAENSHSSTFL